MLQLWKNNRLPLLTAVITSDDTTPFDLTGGTVTFNMRPEGSGLPKISAGSATVTNGTAGAVSYAWGTADTDTCGEFTCWWTYSTAGKSQDTDEFNITISEHAPEITTWVNPVSSDGSTRIFQGDAYLATKNTALVYDLSLQDQPNLTGSTVTFKVAGQGSAITATVSDPSTVSVDITSAQSAAYTAGIWDFALYASMGGSNVSTILRSKITVTGSLS